MSSRKDAALLRLIVNIGMQVVATLILRFVFFNLNAMSVGVWIFANSGDHPRDLHSRFAARYLESVVSDLFSNVESRRRRSNCCELVAEIHIESLKPFREFYPGFSSGVEY